MFEAVDMSGVGLGGPAEATLGCDSATELVQLQPKLPKHTAVVQQLILKGAESRDPL